jgi:RNA polymerase sigma-32 factor
MSTALQVVHAQLPIGNIDSYIQKVNEIPYLSAEEEYALSLQYQEQGDLQAAQKLVLSHLRYVVRVARGYLGYGLPLADLIQEGSVGLMKAVKRFDPKVGVRLVSFAVHWIKAEIHEYILRNWRIVKIATTKAQRKLFFNLRNAKKRLGWSTREEVETLANDLGVASAEVWRMEERLNAKDIAFDLPDDSESETAHTLAPVEYLADEQNNPEVQLTQENWHQHAESHFKTAFLKLDPRSRHILEQRWLLENDKKTTLQALAEVYGISMERIRQLEKAALEKLKQMMLSAQQ